MNIGKYLLSDGALCLLLLTPGCGCFERDQDSKLLEMKIRRLSNADIEWDHSVIGMYPKWGQNVGEIFNCGEKGIPELIDGLASKERYVVSHVLLVNIVSSLGRRYFDKADLDSKVTTWDGLTFIYILGLIALNTRTMTELP